MRNRNLERKKGITATDRLFTSRSGNQWLIETRWSKLEKEQII